MSDDRLTDDVPAETAGNDGLRTLHAVPELTPAEELALQQLSQVRFWHQLRGDAALTTEAGPRNVPPELLPPDRWELLRGLTLHEWQYACINHWFDAGRRGVVKVVTGAGKTVLALAIAERLQNREHPGLRLAIIVPTVVLLTQWIDEICEHGNLPRTCIGSIGGGRCDAFDDHVRVLVCVINSASKKLPAEVARAELGGQLLLIVDECHRAGAAEMRHVLDTPHAFSLGLSATPERDDDDPGDASENADLSMTARAAAPFEESVVGTMLGPVVYELSYAQAIEQGILPAFRVVHHGLSLRPPELARYERLSREIKDLRSALETPSRRGLALIRWCRSAGAAGNPKAQRLVGLTAERKRLIYRIEERATAVAAILQAHVQADPETKTILFHESIDEVMQLFSILRSAGLPVVAEHSELPDAMRAESLRLFRTGAARVIVSARSLIEGFNVPSADIGIVVAASSSVRQRVQTLGRLLRKSQKADGGEKQATLYVLYAARTVDELVYEKADWEHLIGARRNEYFLWTDVRTTVPKPQAGPPRRPLASEASIDPASLTAGGTYPGHADDGRQYTQDTQGTIRDSDGHLVKPHPELLALLRAHGSKGGRFRVTHQQRFVVKLEKVPDGWQALYLGQLSAAPQLAEDHPDDSLDALVPGARYPLGKARGRTFSVLQRDRRLIATKTPDGIRFVSRADQIADPRKASALREIQDQLALAHARGHRISKITVTSDGHVIYIFDSEAYFIGIAPEGPDGFTWEELPATPA